MIWYAVEILYGFVLLALVFALYRTLVSSPQFTRVVEETLNPKLTVNDLLAASEALQADAGNLADASAAEILHKAKELRRVRKLVS